MILNNVEDLKREFIKAFGETKWLGLEMIHNLREDIEKLFQYLNVEHIPVVMDVLNEDSEYNYMGEYVVISERLIGNTTKVLECIIHELRHYYQIKLITSDDNGVMTNVFREDLKKMKTMTKEQRAYNSLELDAYAFVKYIMANWYDIEWHHPDEQFDMLIDHYIEEYLVV